MYSDKLVVCIKSSDGKVLREHGDTVYVPYGEEYSIYIKNLNSVRASVSIEIDGKNIFSDGSTLVVRPNSDTYVERFVARNDKGNKFKFIEKTGKISEARGDKAEDGLIRIGFKYEKLIPAYVVPVLQETHIHHHYRNPFQLIGSGSPDAFLGSTSIESSIASEPITKSPLRGMMLNKVEGSTLSSRGLKASSATGQSAFAQSANVSLAAAPVSEKGITVAGSVSNQQFNSIGAFPLETVEHVMVLRMLGELGQNKPVEKAVVVKRKVKCETCGTSNKGTVKFCSECGTAISELVV